LNKGEAHGVDVVISPQRFVDQDGIPIIQPIYHNAEILTWSPHPSNPKSYYFSHFFSLGHSIIDNSKFQNMLLSFECYAKLFLYLRAFRT
jgi:hypothetical protein